MKYLFLILSIFLIGMNFSCSFYGSSNLRESPPAIEIVIDYQLHKELEKTPVGKAPTNVELLSTDNPYNVPINFIGKKRNKDELISL